MSINAALAPIIVASTVDQGFLPLIEVVATSIALSARSGRPIDYHVFYDGPDSVVARRLESWRSGDVRVHLHRVANELNRYGTIGGFPPSALLRLTLPQLLPDISRLVYLDADVIVQGDIAELFDTDLGGLPVASTVDRALVENAVRDPSPYPQIRPYLTDVLGFDTEESIRDYRLSGVMVMDLTALRAIDFTDRAMSVLDEKADRLLYPDQCVTNIVLRGRMARLDPRWNATAYEMDAGKLPPDEVRLIHYAGPKPWQARGVKYADQWWAMARKSGRGQYFVPRNSCLPTFGPERPR